MRRAGPLPPTSGLTLVELMVVVAVTGVLLTLAAPSFFDYLLMQRLRGVHAQLVTDLQFARSEAVARNEVMRVYFRANSSVTCYTIYTSQAAPPNSVRCNCTLGQGAACPTAGTTEVRTVEVPVSRKVTVTVPDGAPDAFAFDPVTGGLLSIPQDFPSLPLDEVQLDARIDVARSLRTQVNRAGRPTVCAPAGSTLPEVTC